MCTIKEEPIQRRLSSPQLTCVSPPPSPQAQVQDIYNHRTISMRLSTVFVLASALLVAPAVQ
ncbi:uncharacterized protein FIBRA_03092 [Fibroporia radiculosa]|uniref:Uncharacterized protein n=1 Tax=Fibroporia radiculosa TaxID=599839 RepID=J4H277_9APHY|nr:uncharacterized protein FIBRA_03092 [Fibroporia radiculosa]CCM01044.1 predicted protein [Fibroporia radiculosa]